MTDAISELEGAILAEIHHRGRRTAFQVRRAFQLSPSSEWSGSAGAVYPAIRRMTQAGLIATALLPGGRRAQSLELTQQGVDALTAWTCDVGRACGVGLDPFRLRSGLWRELPAAPRRDVLIRLEAAIRSELESMPLNDVDAVERARHELAVVQQESRLSWIARELENLGREEGRSSPVPLRQAPASPKV